MKTRFTPWALLVAMAVFGCGDDDLYRFRHVHGGRWSHQLPLPDSLPDGDPVGETEIDSVLGDADVLVDFTTPDAALPNRPGIPGKPARNSG